MQNALNYCLGWINYLLLSFHFFYNTVLTLQALAVSYEKIMITKERMKK